MMYCSVWGLLWLKLARQTADRVRKYPRGVEIYLVKGVSDEVVCLCIRIKHSSSDG
jgi:hypothetical protein